MKNIIGIDIGGTKIMAGLFESGDFQNPAKKYCIPTEAHKGREKVLKKIVLAIEKLRDKNTKSVGIAWAGFVDSKNGVTHESLNLPGFANFPITEFLAKKINLPIFIENDARLFALAEQKTCNPKDSVFLGIIFGTGVGSGAILNGKVFSGAQNFAGDVGYQIFYSEKEKQNISAENLFAGPGLEKFLGQNLVEIVNKMENDSAFKEKIREKMIPRIDQISIWIYNLILTLNPEKIVFGGSVGINFWPNFFTEISQKVNEKINSKNLPIKFKLEKSKLENAGLIGAAILADKK